MTAICSELSSGGIPLSVTRTVSRFVLGAGTPTVGQVNNPLVVMLAEAGAPASRLKASACAGKSESVACARKVSVWPSWTNLFPIGASTGTVLLIGQLLAAPGVGAAMKMMLVPPSGQRPWL